MGLVEASESYSQTHGVIASHLARQIILFLGVYLESVLGEDLVSPSNDELLHLLPLPQYLVPQLLVR